MQISKLFRNCYPQIHLSLKKFENYRNLLLQLLLIVSGEQSNGEVIDFDH